MAQAPVDLGHRESCAQGRRQLSASVSGRLEGNAESGEKRAPAPSRLVMKHRQGLALKGLSQGCLPQPREGDALVGMALGTLHALGHNVTWGWLVC